MSSLNSRSITRRLWAERFPLAREPIAVRRIGDRDQGLGALVE
jgi:hypothetical protein